MKFCDMPYERIDVKAATEALDAAAERLSAAKTLGEAEEAFSERENIVSHVQTMRTIASMRKRTTSTTKTPRLLNRASRNSPRRCLEVRFARSLKRNTAS